MDPWIELIFFSQMFILPTYNFSSLAYFIQLHHINELEKFVRVINSFEYFTRKLTLFEHPVIAKHVANERSSTRCFFVYYYYGSLVQRLIPMKKSTSDLSLLLYVQIAIIFCEIIWVGAFRLFTDGIFMWNHILSNRPKTTFS